MNGQCELYADLLVQEALGDISEKERAFLKAHLEGCAECRRELALLSDTIGALRRERQAEAPAGLAERTFHRIGTAGERLMSAATSFEGTDLLSPSTWRIRKSLVGWMVAASVLVMAVASLVPGLVGGADTGKVAVCQQNMRFLGTALRQYAVDHNGFYPQGPDWYKSLDWEYLKRQNVFICPARLAVGKPSEAEVDYVYAPGKVTIHAGEKYPLLWDRKAFHERGGRNVLFADGRVTWMVEDEFQMLLAKWKIDEAEAHYNTP